jgi:hypothetical protein
MKKTLFILLSIFLIFGCKKENIDNNKVKSIIREIEISTDSYYNYYYLIEFYEDAPDYLWMHGSNISYNIGDTLCFHKCVIDPSWSSVNNQECDDKPINCN